MAYSTFGSAVPPMPSQVSSFSPDPNIDPEPPSGNVGGGGGACNCAQFAYERGHKCFSKCNGGGDVDPAPGGCPPNTPPGRAPCCPEGKVWRDDDKVCEFEDDRQKRGEDTCRDATPNCPPGQGSWCDFTDARQKCAPNGSDPNAGKGGGGGGGGTSRGGNDILPDLAGGASKQIWDVILKRLNGESRYTPGVVSGLLGGTKTMAENQARIRTEQSNADLAGRGIARSTIAAGAQREIRGDVSNTVLQEWGKIQRAKIDADFQDKSEAIKEGLDWVNSLRDFIARSNATNAARESAMANVSLGYARLTQEMNQLRERYAQQLNLCIISGACAGGV